MSRLALIDAYNAMYRLLSVVPEDRDTARRLLVARTQAALLAGTLQPRARRAHLVFDTWPGAERAGLRDRAGTVSWHYAHGSADEAIIEHLRRHEGRALRPSVVVVTDDRELGGRARQLGATTVGIRAFFTVPPAARSVPTRPGIPGSGSFDASDFGLPEGPIDLDDQDLLD